MRRWQTAKDVDFCTLYLESLFSKGMQGAMARYRWKLQYCELLVNAADASVGDAPENGGEVAGPMRALLGSGLERNQVTEVTVGGLGQRVCWPGLSRDG